MPPENIFDTSNPPWWLRVFVQIGFPTALAITLVAALLGWMPSPIMQTLSRLEYNAWQQTYILRSICYRIDNNENLSKARMECDVIKEYNDNK